MKNSVSIDQQKISSEKHSSDQLWIQFQFQKWKPFKWSTENLQQQKEKEINMIREHYLLQGSISGMSSPKSCQINLTLLLH